MKERRREANPRGAVATAALAAALCLSPGRGEAFDVIPGLLWPEGTAPFSVNPNFPDLSSPGTEDAEIEAIVCAAAAWTDQSRAAFRFEFRGATQVAAVDTLDGVNAVFFSESDGNEAYSTIVYRLGKPGVRPPAFDIVYYRSTGGWENVWSALEQPPPRALDIQGVATHELGHALGLDHSEMLDATMYPNLRGNGLSLRTLHPDDRDGVEFLYGLRTQEQPSVEILGVVPRAGPPAGGNEVVISGRNFTYKSDTKLWFAGAELPRDAWIHESCGRIRVPSLPRGRPGAVELAISNSVGSAVLSEAYVYAESPPLPFVRGDADGDGEVRLTDAIVLLRYLFRGGAARDCDDARDANDDGSVDLSDAVTVLLYLFDPRVASLPAPFPGGGLDPTEDELGCFE